MTGKELSARVLETFYAHNGGVTDNREYLAAMLEIKNALDGHILATKRAIEQPAPVNTVLEQVKTAYADCWMTDVYGEGMRTRNLNFRASEPVPPDEAQMIARSAIPHGYNAFEASLLGKFPDDCLITFAREGSVCVYVKPGTKPLPKPRQLHCDEYDFEDGILRVWWD